jgi:hypothetical protein
MSHPHFRNDVNEASRMFVRASIEDRSSSGRSEEAFINVDPDSGEDADREGNQDAIADIVDAQASTEATLVNKIRDERWTFRPPMHCPLIGRSTRVIKRPTASYINHPCLTPWIYRTLRDLGGLERLALLLGVREDWRSICDAVVANAIVREAFSEFIDRDQPERISQGLLSTVITEIAILLRGYIPVRSLDVMPDKKVIVGGILADFTLDVRSTTDVSVQVKKGKYLIATEIKTATTFPRGHVWHGKCRGTQVLTALYGFYCPTFLLTPEQWKLFVETPERNGIFTHPFSPDPSLSGYMRSITMGIMDDDFLRAITICLLRDSFISQSNTPISANSISSTTSVGTATVQGNGSNYVTQPIKPSVMTGVSENGAAQYRTLRVYTPEEVAVIEAEIEAEENQENIAPSVC